MSDLPPCAKCGGEWDTHAGNARGHPFIVMRGDYQRWNAERERGGNPARGCAFGAIFGALLWLILLAVLFIVVSLIRAKS